MQEKMEHISESVDKGYCNAAIEQSIDLLVSNKDGVNIEKIKEKILSCLGPIDNTCDIQVNYDISRLEYILSHDLLSVELDDDYRSELYYLLAEKYFQILDIQKAQLNYLESYELGNTKIFEKYIYIEVLTKIGGLNKGDPEYLENFLLSDIFNTISTYKKEGDFLGTIESDFKKFMLGNISPIKEPLSIYDYIYNLEIFEEKLIEEMLEIHYNKEKYEIEDEYDIKIKDLSFRYESLCYNYELVLEAFNGKGKELIKMSYHNMKKRFELAEKIDFFMYGSYINNMIDFSGELIDLYIKNGKYDEIINLYNFLFTNIKRIGDKELKSKVIGNIYNNIDLFSKTLNNYDFKSIIYSLLDGVFMNKDDYIKIADMLLLLGDYLVAYNIYINQIDKGELLNKKIFNLLSDIMLKKNFNEASEEDYKEPHYDSKHNRFGFLQRERMDSIQRIGFLIEKLEQNKVLTIGDYNDILELCSA